MGTVTAAMVIPSNLRSLSFPHHQHNQQQMQQGQPCFIRAAPSKKRPFVPVMRLFGPAIFEASKLKVLFVGVDGKKHPEKLPRTYTLTHSDVTSMLTLAISQTINNSQLQGWYNRLQRDEVVAEWKKVKGKMSLHVHCHISGGHFLLDLVAKLRYYIFCKELPVVLKAFVHGDENLFNNFPELQDSVVWVYFHSNLPEYNKVECWGSLHSATGPVLNAFDQKEYQQDLQASLPPASNWEMPQPCKEACACCFPPMSSIPWSEDHARNVNPGNNQGLQQQS
ncbi:hypothetical protein Drorol1_Dr00005343 [Drosera rotundifolia]